MQQLISDISNPINGIHLAYSAPSIEGDETQFLETFRSPFIPDRRRTSWYHRIPLSFKKCQEIILTKFDILSKIVSTSNYTIFFVSSTGVETSIQTIEEKITPFFEKNYNRNLNLFLLRKNGFELKIVFEEVNDVILECQTLSNEEKQFLLDDTSLTMKEKLIKNSFLVEKEIKYSELIFRVEKEKRNSIMSFKWDLPLESNVTLKVKLFPSNAWVTLFHEIPNSYLKNEYTTFIDSECFPPPLLPICDVEVSPKSISEIKVKLLFCYFLNKGELIEV